MIAGNSEITATLVDKVFDDLRKEKYGGEKLDVIVHSSGGSIDAAYNLARLFRRYGKERLTFVVPRWAKSAATLLVCAGDEILMTPVAELGPLDPQITQMNPLEQRLENFSPLHIESTLQLIRDEFKSGADDLASRLLQRLQFPLTLGSFKKLLDLGNDYLENLLTSRMLIDQQEEIKSITTALTTGYADHSWCITSEEAQKIGLVVEEIEGNQLDIVWEIHNLNKQKEKLVRADKQKKMMEQFKDLPPNLIDELSLDAIGIKPGKNRILPCVMINLEAAIQRRRNRMKDLLDIPTRLAAALLLKRGEISLDEISSLPFVESKESAETIVYRLTRFFEIDRDESDSSRSAFPIDDVIRFVGKRIKKPTGQPVNSARMKSNDVLPNLMDHLDDDTREELKERAQLHGNPIEVEASLILRDVLTKRKNIPTPPNNLVSSIRDKFAPLGGVELELPNR